MGSGVEVVCDEGYELRIYEMVVRFYVCAFGKLGIVVCTYAISLLLPFIWAAGATPQGRSPVGVVSHRVLQG